VLTTKRRPAGGTGPTDIVTTMTYVVGPTVVTCPAPEATCNKPLTEQNGRLQTTNYAWNSDGTLQSVTRPADPAGVRPQITLTYSTALNGTDGTPLKLLTGKTEKISSTVSTTTSYTRSAANKYTIAAATVDSGTGKLNLRTCTRFDAAGNLISLSDPRQGVCP
jgi:YD repeat-containing protein